MKTVDDLVSSVEEQAIAKEAYIYGFPLVDSYRIQYSYFRDKLHPEFKAPWNQIHHNSRVYTPDDKAIPYPNADTVYSHLGVDLRSEPIVLTVPAVESGRFYSIQFVDLYTFNFAYVGSRVTGNAGGSFVLAGPRWKGKTPDGITSVIQSETDFVFVLYRTQIFNPGDIMNVKRVQAGYKVQTLSQFLGTPPPAAAPVIDFARPLTFEQEHTSLEFFKVLNFVLRFCPTHPSEKGLMARLAKLGIGPGKTFDAYGLSPETRRAIKAGMAEAWREYDALEKKMASGERTSADLFGSRAALNGNYLYRMVGAVDGIHGNSKEETIGIGYFFDSDGQELDGATNRYTIRFEPGQLPPVNGFWSLTMYQLASRLLVPNLINRYLINSPMLPDLKRDPDGGLTLYIQRESPGKDKESNWLPTPYGLFFMGLRLYWPKPEGYDGSWRKPLLERQASECIDAEAA